MYKQTVRFKTHDFVIVLYLQKLTTRFGPDHYQAIIITISKEKK
jgi:hypothetical protein